MERCEYLRQLQRIAAGQAPLESILQTQDLYDNHFDDSPVWQQALAAANDQISPGAGQARGWR